MSKNARVMAIVALIIGGLTYWYEVGPGTGTSIEMEPRATASGDGFDVAVPEGFLFVTDDRMQVPEGGVALAKPPKADVGPDGESRGSEEQTSTIIVVPVAPRTPPFDPTDAEQCASMGEQMSSGGKIRLTGTGLIDSPFGKTCEVQLSQGDAIRGRLVIAYRGARQWSITCRLDSGDPQADAGCQQVIDGLSLK